MSTKTYYIPIVKGTDSDYYQALQAIAGSVIGKELNLAQLSINSFTGANLDIATFDGAESDEEFKHILDANGKTIRSMMLKGAQNISVAIHRSDKFDQATPTTTMEDMIHVAIEQGANESVQKQFLRLVAPNSEGDKGILRV